MTDSSIGAFLAARRKAIAGLLAFTAVLIAGGIVPHQVALAVQAIIAFLGVYGIHEIANDPLPQPQNQAVAAPFASAPSADYSPSMGPDLPN